MYVCELRRSICPEYCEQQCCKQQCAPQTPLVQVFPGMQPPMQLRQDPPRGMLMGMHIGRVK